MTRLLVTVALTTTVVILAGLFVFMVSVSLSRHYEGCSTIDTGCVVAP